MGKNKKKKKKHHGELPEGAEPEELNHEEDAPIEKFNKKGKLSNAFYNQEILRLQTELVKLQYWVKETGLKVIVLFEGRDAAGKGGVIKRITEPLNPRGCRVVALDKPSDREKTQWYFQRYVSHLPSAGEMVIFDRSWYNRAGVEHVMNFCTENEYQDFLRSCPEFEKMLIRSGITILKFWFSVNDEEQEKRFRERATDPARRWKLSPMDLASFDKWVEFSKAKDEMFKYTDTKQSPWIVVEADDKKRARLNCIAYILNTIKYKDVVPELMELPPRKIVDNYIRPPKNEYNFIPEVY
ncbi:MAG: polyphosphate kinase 2 [Ignavibacteria bacterium]|nr:polyphosphate kinase 2 [Ignavibacteria bacterium]